MFLSHFYGVDRSLNLFLSHFYGVDQSLIQDQIVTGLIDGLAGGDVDSAFKEA